MQQSGRFCELRSQQSGRLCKSEVSSQRGFVSLEVSSRGCFGFRGRSGGDFVSFAVRNRESLSRSKRGVGGEQEASRGVR